MSRNFRVFENSDWNGEATAPLTNEDILAMQRLEELQSYAEDIPLSLLEELEELEERYTL